MASAEGHVADHDHLGGGDYTVSEEEEAHGDDYMDMPFASRYLRGPLQRNKFPSQTVPARVAQQIVRDARNLDATPRLNLASFVTTWMEPECDDLIKDSININYIDEAEYPSTTQVHNNCVAMLADLWHAEEAVGTATVGSSEAILLGGLAMKRCWADRRKAEGKPVDRPNIICSSTVHVAWEKLFNYFEIEARLVNITKDRFIPLAEEMVARVDENTIGVVGILGSTYTGHYEDIKGIDAALEEVNKKNGWNVGIHVDGASGGFVAPFTSPDLEWDFRLKNVVSINASGHKYGLVYPGVGWLAFRNSSRLPESLIFHDNYLGNDQKNFTLNFSKGGYQIIAQFYQFMRLGRPGYTKVMRACAAVAKHLAAGIEATGNFHVLSPRYPEPGLPVTAFTLLEHKRNHGYDEFDVADKLRERGWVLPAYSMAPDAQAIRGLRVVCREDFSRQSADTLLEDIIRAVDWLDAHYSVYTPQQLEQVKHKTKSHQDRKHKRTAPHKHGVC